MKINSMEKPNPDDYNSTGFYLDDLEKYNHMIPQKIIDKIKMESKELPKICVPSFLHPEITRLVDNITAYTTEAFSSGAIYGYQLRDDEVVEWKKAVIEGSELYVNFITKSKGAVWDYSDIAIKFKNWSNGIKFENENAAFTFFFEEVYNRK